MDSLVDRLRCHASHFSGQRSDDETEAADTLIAQAERIAALEAERTEWFDRANEQGKRAERAESRAAEHAYIAGAQSERPQSRAALDVLAERARQVAVEGWTPEHDDEHANGELADAAACYAATARVFRGEEFAGRGYELYVSYRDLWPFDDRWWKPKDRRRDLIRAAALILAEIERLDRINPPEDTP